MNGENCEEELDDFLINELGMTQDEIDLMDDGALRDNCDSHSPSTTPDAIVSSLEKLGVKMTRRTLLNYEKWELISKPKRGGGGTGGRWTEYPSYIVEEAFASYCLIHGEYSKRDKIMSVLLSEKPPTFSPSIIKVARIAGINQLDHHIKREWECNDSENDGDEKNLFDVNSNVNEFGYLFPMNTLDKIAFNLGDKLADERFNSYEDLPAYFLNLVQAATILWVDRYLAAEGNQRYRWGFTVNADGVREAIIR